MWKILTHYWNETFSISFLKEPLPLPPQTLKSLISYWSAPITSVSTGTSSTAATPWRTPRWRSTCGSRPRSLSTTPHAPSPGCTSKPAPPTIIRQPRPPCSRSSINPQHVALINKVSCWQQFGCFCVSVNAVTTVITSSSNQIPPPLKIVPIKPVSPCSCGKMLHQLLIIVIKID